MIRILGQALAVVSGWVCLCKQGAFLAIASLFVACPSSAQTTAWSVFSFDGVRMDFPESWRISSGQEQLTLRAWVEAVSKSPETARRAGEQHVILHAIAPNSMGFASVRIVRNPPDPGLSQEKIMAASSRELGSAEAQMRRSMETGVAAGGYKLVTWGGMQRKSVGSLYALDMHYRRTGLEGMVVVNYVLVPVGNSTVAVTLSYRQSEEALWRPFIGRMRDSLRVG